MVEQRHLASRPRTEYKGGSTMKSSGSNVCTSGSGKESKGIVSSPLKFANSVCQYHVAAIQPAVMRFPGWMERQLLILNPYAGNISAGQK